MRDRGGTVLGVDMLDVTGRAQEFIDEYGLTYPMLKDKDGEGLEQFGVVQYPETFVIDRQGRIAAVQRGPVDEEFLRRSVAPLLERS
jgi:cytochrome c biogenesis protein CcmG, thiol:disulfide interchange protein DsbE